MRISDWSSDVCSSDLSWREPDEGIWEVRGGRQHFTFSKVMAWAAFDRGIKGVEEFGLAGPVDHWRKLRSQVHEDVCRHGFDDELGSYVQSYGSKQLDASLLLLPSRSEEHKSELQSLLRNQ